ncbi:MAG: haloacid dehalogenase-like hydrolase [Bradymonadaceae bacterium]|nr:haloacid dehalogenase-like hydrolase [Lujinxingiaceae bacterium]
MTHVSPLLPKQGWRPQVHERLLTLIADQGARSSQAAPPLAVFDFDNTCILNDIGELFSHFLIDEMLYRYDLDAFWELIHPDDGRDALCELTREAYALAPTARTASACYQRYLREMGALYGRRLVRAGKADCYEWAVRLHVGMTIARIEQLATEAIVRELGREVHRERRESPSGSTVSIDRGIRMFAEIRTLIDVLTKSGFEVWIVSATNIWTVQTFAPLFGVPPERVLGNRLRVGEDGVLSSETLAPVLFRQGKVDAIAEYIGRIPVLALGDSDTDYEMLCAASELAIVVDQGNALLRDEARRLGWAVQPQSELTPLDAAIGGLS